jgi:hypothetical protein
LAPLARLAPLVQLAQPVPSDRRVSPVQREISGRRALLVLSVLLAPLALSAQRVRWVRLALPARRVVLAQKAMLERLEPSVRRARLAQQALSVLSAQQALSVLSAQQALSVLSALLVPPVLWERPVHLAQKVILAPLGLSARWV